MTYLVAISIGPVQEFIAAARRCRDLWYGSRLLSEISKAAALKLKQQHGATLIFPAPEHDEDLEENSDFTVVNKLLASVDSTDIGGLLEDVRRAARSRLKGLADLSKTNLRGTTLDEGLYQRQLSGFVEFYSAWAPLTDDYRVCRNRVEELLAARKHLRDFRAYQGEEGKRKSSLDGGRESVIERRSKRLWASNLKDNEYLDAIGIVKRFGDFGQRNPRFDSTVDVAAAPFVKACKNGSEERRSAFRRFQRLVVSKGLMPETCSLLYEHESRQLFDEDKSAAGELKEIRATLGAPIPPYYALLVGDGDRMGRAISDLREAADHRRFSQALSGFADEARKKIEYFEGCPIYCGGDDVMALVPLHTAIPCAQAISDLFQESLGEHGVTFSAGLAVAHALEPLNEVLDWAREAERTAKEKGGRNALCVSVHPRSGAPITIYGKWSVMAGSEGLLTELVALDVGDSKAMPRGLGYELRELVDRLEDWDDVNLPLRELVLAVAKKKECSAKARQLIDDHSRDRSSIKHLYQSMMVARWFARAEREANGL